MSHLVRIAVGLVLAASARHASAQSLADRVAGAGQPRVQFTFAGRPEVCGDGRSFIRVFNNEWYGSWSGDANRAPCAAGPVRVVLDRAGREVVSIAVYAGPMTETPAGVADLGRIRARDAADYLLGLAERSQGRVSRDAIMPALLADSFDFNARLLAIAKNQDAARQTRSSAISWLARPLSNLERNVQPVADALVSIARDEDDNQSVRQQALRTLARLEHGAGTTVLIQLARDTQRGWLAREAVSAVNSSGDPRARTYLREVVRRADAPDDVLASAVRTLGADYATGEDIKIIRDSWATLPGEKSREAAMQSIAQFGGAENVRWMVGVARDANQPVKNRVRAVQHAYRGGSSVSDLVKIYDENTDPQIKEAVMTALVDSGEKTAIDKLMEIARRDESLNMRRRAITKLGQSSDQRVKKFLTDLAEVR
ncbi:MAG: HEAT repeat domain-containing protein [Gemmatimonadota bacterium]